ncbi:MAG: protein kinase, partial [Phycisphaerae bacterium]|nr:protein kinase [Phycisphaerae bacterium]
MADDQSHNILADSVAKTACHKCGSVVDVSSEPAFSTITCPQCSAQFTAPGRLGGFVLLKELGKGEMGATYKAYEKSLGRYVAIKVMHGELGQDPARVDGFMSEGRALASLDNPNIVRVFSLGQEKDQLYIAMELISGGGMEKKFSKEKPLGEVPALEIITGVARALKAAGQIGLIHGDVKPENIMLSDKGRPKLVDFGIARFGGGKIAEGDALGTPYYVAPEQVERGSVDHRADIYSLGATMYHALAGEAPFTGDSLMKVLYVRIEGPVPDITKVRQDLHPETVEVLAHMLQKNPDDRYATYDDLLKDLLKACWAAGAEIIQDAEEAIPVAEKLTGPDWHRLIWPLAGFGAVIVAAVLWFVFFRGSTPPPEPKPDPTPVVMKVGDPKLSRRGGPISGPTSVTITCNTPAARIYYTTDGSVPTVDSQLYGGAITVSPGDTLRARAFRDGWDKSSVVEAEYTRDKAVLTDVVGIRADAGAAWGKVKQLDRAQGFGDKIDQGAKLYSQASDLYDKEAYSACKPLYASLVKLCAELN